MLQYKDRHSYALIAEWFGLAVCKLVDGMIVKVTLYPELYCLWRAVFQKKDQKLLRGGAVMMAFHEAGSFLITTSCNVVVQGRLSNPVDFKPAFGLFNVKPGTGTAPQAYCSAKDARFEDLAGVDFLARQVAVVADAGRHELRILHLCETDDVYVVRGIRLQKPHAIATVSRLDWSPGAERDGANQEAKIAVTETGKSEVLLVTITQQPYVASTKQRAPYTASVTRIVMVDTSGLSQSLPLISVCAKPVGRVEIGVLRRRRDNARASGVATAQVDFESQTRECSALYIARAGYTEQEGSNRPAIVRIDLDQQVGEEKRDGSGRVKRFCRSEVIAGNLDFDPFDVAIDQEDSVYISSKSRSAVWRVSCESGSWQRALYAGTGAIATRAQPKDGKADCASFTGVAGLAVLPTGRTVFAIDVATASVVKMVNLAGFVKYATAWRETLGCFGERDPTVPSSEHTVRTWATILPDLKKWADELDGIRNRRADACGCPGGQGPELMLDGRSLDGHTKVTVPSMFAAYEYIKSFDPCVAENLDPRAVLEKVIEFHWAKARTLAQDRAFDLVEYLVICPRVQMETMKKYLDCGFNYDTKHRKIDKTSYAFENVVKATSQRKIKFQEIYGGPHHKPPTIMERTGPPHNRRLTGRVVPNSNGVWDAVGDTRRIPRRLDARYLQSQLRKFYNTNPDASALSEKDLHLARNGMRRLRRILARMRETMLRTRMRQTVSTPYQLIERDALDLADELTYINRVLGSGGDLSGCDILRVGDLLLRNTDDARGWTIATVVEHVANRQSVALGCSITIVDGKWDEERRGFSFVCTRRNWARCQFRHFFATKPELHLSELYVVEPDSFSHESDNEVESEVAIFSEAQICEFGRIAALDAERPRWQREWWLPVKADAERPRPAVADVREREGEAAAATAARADRAAARR